MLECKNTEKGGFSQSGTYRMGMCLGCQKQQKSRKKVHAFFGGVVYKKYEKGPKGMFFTYYKYVIGVLL